MNLRDLPSIRFADKDPQLIEDEVVARFETITKRKLGAADPIYLLVKVFIAELVAQRSDIDFTGKQNLLAYSSGGFLLQKVADFGLVKIPAQPAKTTIRFTLTQALLTVLVIPNGTRVTPDNRIYFQVPADTPVNIGETCIDIICECTTTGIIGNNIAPGQINNIADPIPYVQGAVNLDISSGGADEESDDNLRERRLVAPDALSTAGPNKSYEFYARSASKDIIDISVISPTPGVVKILPLMTAGRLPTQIEMDRILNECNPDDRRPLTDNVLVAAPQQVNYDVELTYWISSKTNIGVEQIKNNVSTAINNFITYQKTKIGKAIIPEVLIELIMLAGARRVNIVKPSRIELTKEQVANLVERKVTFAGIEVDN